MKRLRVVVEFLVEAEEVGPWDAEACARDFVRHRIEEGVVSEAILGWEIVSVEEL